MMVLEKLLGKKSGLLEKDSSESDWDIKAIGFCLDNSGPIWNISLAHLQIPHSNISVICL